MAQIGRADVEHWGQITSGPVMSFDPYHKWLGIPSDEQPPNHYRLLGLRLFESDADVISSAADQRMTHLRSFQTGKRAEYSQRILNEVAAARICLLDSGKKKEYDATLCSQLAPPPIVQAMPTTVPSMTTAPPGAAPAELPPLQAHNTAAAPGPLRSPQDIGPSIVPVKVVHTRPQTGRRYLPQVAVVAVIAFAGILALGYLAVSGGFGPQDISHKPTDVPHADIVPDPQRHHENDNELATAPPDENAHSGEPEPVGELFRFAGQSWGTFSPDGRRVVTSSSDKTLRLWDVETRREILRFSGHTARPRLLCFSPSGEHIVSGADDATIRVWDASTASELQVFRVGAVPQKVNPMAVVVADGKRLLWFGEDRRVRLTDLDTGRSLLDFALRHPGDKARGIAFSPDGRWALSGGLRSTSRIWSVATGKSFEIKGKSQAYGGALSPDGQFALTGGWDKILFLWRLRQRVEVARFVGHGGHIYDATFSMDGRRILSGDGNGDVRLWDIKTGEQLHVYRGHNKPISRVCISSDGRYGLSSGNDGTVRLWGLPPD